MNLDLLKKNSIVEKEEAFMPLVFVDISVPTAVVVGTLARQTGYSFKKATIAPSNSLHEVAPEFITSHISPFHRDLMTLRHSIKDIDY